LLDDGDDKEARMRLTWLLTGVLCFVAAPALAQDPVKVDPQHWKVEFENDQVRVLRFKGGPHEKSPMHEHPNTVFVSLTGGKTRFTLPDGKTRESPRKAGEVVWAPAEKHSSESLSDKPQEGILIELKGKPAEAKPPAKAPAAKAPAKKAP
jgi:quercetin dioxygenase-like cupin family protein